jgi:TonB-linked SusC/RagA family outer membrane protein
LTEIKAQTGYEVSGSKALLERARTVTAKAQNEPLNRFLDRVFADQPLTYSITENVIVVKPKAIQPLVDRKADAQEIFKVKGKVVSSQGRAIIRVTVKVQGTFNMALTNDYGEFELNNVRNIDSIEFSYVGFESKTLRAKPDLGAVVLLESTESLQEVVISTGYQDIKKHHMVGSTATIKGEDLTITGTMTLEQMLQGKLPGMEVVNMSGQVGTRQTVRVRGTSTLLGNQEPVWVVDGIIQEDPLPFQASELNRFGSDPSNAEAMKNYIGSAISWLNPYDIEQITILKDAASTAIYGVKAANGVIVITTKRGKTGFGTTVNYNMNMVVDSRLTYDKMNLMNSQERVDVSREIYERGLISYTGLDNVGYSGLLRQFMTKQISYDEFNLGVKQLEINNTDWFDLLFQTPFSQNHSLSLSGGMGNSSFYGSLGYNKSTGQAIGNGQQSYLGNINFSSKVTEKLAVNMRLSANNSTTTGIANISPYAYASTASRVIPAFDENGAYQYFRNRTGFRYNVFNELDNSGNSNDKTAINVSLNVRYQLPWNLSYESTFGGGFTNTVAETWNGEETHGMAVIRGYEYGTEIPVSDAYKRSRVPHGGELSTNDSRNSNFTWRNNMNYVKTFAERHQLSGMAGLELRSNAYKGAFETIYGYIPSRGKVIINPPATIQDGAGNLIANGIYSTNVTNIITDAKSTNVSYYMAGAYTFDDRYIFNMSIRGDASNRFGQDTRSRFRPIWAVGGRWNIASEKWFERSAWMNNISLRGSYGYQGNVAENYGPNLITRIPAGSDAINSLTGEPVMLIRSLPYADLRMEKTSTINLGVDLSLFSNRVTALFDYYQKHSKDLIVMKDVAYENGVLQMPMNGGDMDNYGLDAAFNVELIRKPDFSWSFGLTMTRNWNKIKSELLSNPTWFNAVSGNYYKDDYAVSSFWVFDYKGLDPENGRPTFNIPTVDEDNNAEVDAAAYMVYGGKLNPDFTSGLQTSLRYKKFSLLTSMYLSLGGKKILSSLYTSDMINTTPSEYNNLSKDLVNRWRKPGDENHTNIPSLPSADVVYIDIPTGPVGLEYSGGQSGIESPYTLYNHSTQRVVNTSYLRFQNVSLYYTLPDKWSKKVTSKHTQIGYVMSNPLIFVSKDYKGVDPEVASGSQPISRTHTLSLSVTF